MGQAINIDKLKHELALSTKNMTREQWLQARQSGIGGSDIATIIGVSPYDTAYDIFISKTQEVAEEQNEYAYWGTQLEDVIAREFAKRNDLKIQNVNFLMRHPEHHWAIANIDRAIINPEISGNVRFRDGELTTDTILEVKTASEYVGKDWGNEESDEVPDQYQCQAQWYMAVTNTQVCYMAVLIGGNKFRQYRIERHDEFIDYLFEEAEQFWTQHVATGIAPEPTTLENAKHKYPKHNPDTLLDVPLDSETAKVFEHYESLKAQEKQLKEDIKAAQTDLVCQIKDNEALAIDGEVVATYKTQKKSNFDSKALKADMPELYTKYNRVGENRVMRVK